MTKILAALVVGGGSFLALFLHGQNQPEGQAAQPPNLADAFAQPVPVLPVATTHTTEVEPVVVGRRKWTDAIARQPEPPIPPTPPAKPTGIEELDPLETQQPKPGQIEMPLKPPIIPPAVNIHRHFEGTLVLKPRKLGFERDFPFQLENSRGKRLAFVDVGGLRILDPLDFKDQKVNVLGKLEALEKGSKELVIRARLLRRLD